MLKKYWLAALALALAIGFAVAVAAQPVIAEMKGRWYESWVDFIYDSNPATSGETVVARFDGANTRTILPGDIRVCDTFDDGDSVIPFIHFLQGSDVSGAVDLTEWTVGYTTAGVNP